MKTPITNLILAALLASTSQAQQNPSTSQPTSAQAQPAAASTTSCVKAAPAPPHKQGWLEKKARALACQQNRNLCDLPSSAADITGSTPDAKPCPAPAPGNPATASKPQAQAPSTTPANPASATAGSPPAYVCPPKTTLIPNTPYCLNPDHTTMDAIPLPQSLAAPASPAKAPAQNTTKQ